MSLADWLFGGFDRNPEPPLPLQLAAAGGRVAALRAKLGGQRMDDITRLVAELPPMLGALGRQEAQPAAPRGLAGLSASVSSGAGQRQ